jgi:TRAP-type C4-dicarboxylate transport system permease small subunit
MSDDHRPAQDDVSGRPSSWLALVAKAIELVGLVMFVAVLLVTLLQVLARYLEISLPWTEELARILFLAAMTLGIAVAIQRREHIVVDFLLGRWPARTQAAALIAFDCAILLLLAIWLDGARRLIALNLGSSFITVPWIPVSALYAVEACAIALMMLFVSADLIVQTRRYRDANGL